MNDLVLLICLCVFICSVSCEGEKSGRNDPESLYSLYVKSSKHFDRRYPSPTMMVKRNNGTLDTSQPNNLPFSPDKLTHLHGKRCIIMENSQAVADFVNDKWAQYTRNLPVLVTTPCLGSDSLGNYLGSYFENVVCANKANLHFFGFSPIWEPATYDTPSFFLSHFPSFIEHKTPAENIQEAKQLASQLCRCPGSCHERKNALWSKNIDVIKPILAEGFDSHKKYLEANRLMETIVSSNDMGNVPVGTKLPLIPDAAIHYRCGDNFVGHYGFLPFRAFTQYIPKDVTTIYVLAENRGRKTKQREHLANKCDAAFKALSGYLTKHFPNSQILIQRGGDLNTDLLRLSYAKYTICSVSTFCLWPAIFNPNKAFFPKTKLIVGGNTDINLGFQWIDSPSVILGSQHTMTQPKQFVNMLVG